MITRSFILHLVKNCPEAEEGLQRWQNGDFTFEEAMMETVKHLFIANADLQRRLDYASPASAAGGQ